MCRGAFKTNPHKYNYAYRIAQIPVFILLVVSFITMTLVRNHHKEYLAGKRAPYIKETDIELDDKTPAIDVTTTDTQEETEL